LIAPRERGEAAKSHKVLRLVEGVLNSMLQ
jgi:hypothetical protein